MGKRRELATKYFFEGYNCSQAVVLAFADLIDIPKDVLLKSISPFGGGISRLRETCGAVSGMVFVIGYFKGYSNTNINNKKDTYALTQKLVLKFEEKFGDISCRNLLKINKKHDEAIPSERTKEFYEKRPCPILIGEAANIVEEFLIEEGIIKGEN